MVRKIPGRPEKPDHRLAGRLVIRAAGFEDGIGGFLDERVQHQPRLHRGQPLREVRGAVEAGVRNGHEPPLRLARGAKLLLAEQIHRSPAHVAQVAVHRIRRRHFIEDDVQNPAFAVGLDLENPPLVIGDEPVARPPGLGSLEAPGNFTPRSRRKNFERRTGQIRLLHPQIRRQCPVGIQHDVVRRNPRNHRPEKFTARDQHKR